jgi:hypothetical protein
VRIADAVDTPCDEVDALEVAEVPEAVPDDVPADGLDDAEADVCAVGLADA